MNSKGAAWLRRGGGGPLLIAQTVPWTNVATIDCLIIATYVSYAGGGGDGLPADLYATEAVFVHDGASCTPPLTVTSSFWYGPIVTPDALITTGAGK